MGLAAAQANHLLGALLHEERDAPAVAGNGAEERQHQRFRGRLRFYPRRRRWNIRFLDHGRRREP
jgi:hypothetical protein